MFKFFKKKKHGLGSFTKTAEYSYYLKNLNKSGGLVTRFYLHFAETAMKLNIGTESSSFSNIHEFSDFFIKSYVSENISILKNKNIGKTDRYHAILRLMALRKLREVFREQKKITLDIRS